MLPDIGKATKIEVIDLETVDCNDVRVKAEIPDFVKIEDDEDEDEEQEFKALAPPSTLAEIEERMAYLRQPGL